ncbi:hypothetical protein R0381_000285 [Jeongeupia wiesaeckerbachi]|uniref:hypothetical protein n=1 Tax=Jeongeupia wiesaeckerbachi TaxID=3051218 RepID=UPI003D806929
MQHEASSGDRRVDAAQGGGLRCCMAISQLVCVEAAGLFPHRFEAVAASGNARRHVGDDAVDTDVIFQKANSWVRN